MRSKSDVSRHFIIDAWEATPTIRLVQRNSEHAGDLVSFPLPAELMDAFREEHGTRKGLYTVSSPKKAWLQKAMDQEGMHG